MVFSKKITQLYLDKHEEIATEDKKSDDSKNANTAYKHDTRAERALELTLELTLELALELTLGLTLELP